MSHTIELAIATTTIGPGRIQAGDVVAVHPAGQGWGRAELAGRLIVPATGLTLAEAWGLTAVHRNPAALAMVEDALNRQMEVVRAAWNDALASGKTPQEADAAAQAAFEAFGPLPPMPKIENKRRFRLPLALLKAGWVSGLDLARAADPRDAYQPLLDGKIVVDFGEHVAICLDVHLGTYRFAKQKAAA